jgi:hypothetical protein
MKATHYGSPDGRQVILLNGGRLYEVSEGFGRDLCRPTIWGAAKAEPATPQPGETVIRISMRQASLMRRELVQEVTVAA